MRAAPHHWCLETQDNGPLLTLRFAGRQVRLSEQHLRIADETLFGPGPGVGGREVLLDMANVECLPSTALAGLVRLHEKVAAADGHLRLDAVSPHLYELLEVTQLHHVLDIRQAEGIPTYDGERAEAAPLAGM